MIDFANSYMTWFGDPRASISRIAIEAACTLVDDAGSEDDFYLIAPCRAEHTHSDGQLLVMPNYDFRGIFGRTEHRLLRKHWVSDPDYLGDAGLATTGGRVLDEVGRHADRWTEVRLDVGRFDSFTELADTTVGRRRHPREQAARLQDRADRRGVGRAGRAGVPRQDDERH